MGPPFFFHELSREFVIRVTRRLPVVEQDLLTLPEYLDSHSDIGSVRVLHCVKYFHVPLLRVVRSATNLALKQCSFRLYFQLICKGLIFYTYYFYLFTYSIVKKYVHIR